MGFISQEVQEAVSGKKYMEDSKIVSRAETVVGSVITEKLEFAPSHLMTPVIKALQQLISRIEALEAAE